LSYVKVGYIESTVVKSG